VPVPRRRELVTSSADLHGEVIGVDEHDYALDTRSTMRFQPAFAARPRGTRWPLLSTSSTSTASSTRPARRTGSSGRERSLARAGVC
jgi:hypothetical protein